MKTCQNYAKAKSIANQATNEFEPLKYIENNSPKSSTSILASENLEIIQKKSKCRAKTCALVSPSPLEEEMTSDYLMASFIKDVKLTTKQNGHAFVTPRQNDNDR